MLNFSNPVESRRAFLGNYAGGIGSLALAHLLGTPAVADSPRPGWPAVTVRPRAKSVICLFQHGGPSQMDLFDPKPELQKWHGKPYPGGDLEIHFDKQKGRNKGTVQADEVDLLKW